MKKIILVCLILVLLVSLATANAQETKHEHFKRIVYEKLSSLSSISQSTTLSTLCFIECLQSKNLKGGRK